MRLDPRRSFVALALLCVLGPGCYSSGAGKTPDDVTPYYPTGVALSDTGRHLFVVNSDFDLQFSAGNVVAYGVDAIAAEVERCATEPLGAGCPEGLRRGHAKSAETFFHASVRIGAFAADLRALPRYDAAGTRVPGGRLLVPVRGDASITYIDYDETGSGITLGCYAGAVANSRGFTCDAAHRIGTDPNANSRQLSLEGEPFSVAAPAFWSAELGNGKPFFEPFKSGGIAAVVHQQSGDVSVLVGTHLDKRAPKVAFTVGGLPGGATSVAALDVVDGLSITPPVPFVPRFLVTNRSQATVTVVSFVGDQGEVDRASLAISDVIPINTNSDGQDSRGVVVDPPADGEDRPIRVFLTNRKPASLIVGELDRTTRRLHFFENVPLPFGPSRLTRVRVDQGSGPRTRLVVSSFDARSLVFYDPDTRRVSNVARVGRGPYAMAFDAARRLGFLANFTDSTIQVVQLDPSKAGFEEVVYTIGVPAGPQG